LPYKLGDVSACRRAAGVLCAVQSETVSELCRFENAQFNDEI